MCVQYEDKDRRTVTTEQQFGVSHGALLRVKKKKKIIHITLQRNEVQTFGTAVLGFARLHMYGNLRFEVLM
jgi:hypothetical protein